MTTNGKKPDQTLVVLREIREELRKTNERLDALTSEVQGGVAEHERRIVALERKSG